MAPKRKKKTLAEVSGPIFAPANNAAISAIKVVDAPDAGSPAGGAGHAPAGQTTVVPAAPGTADDAAGAPTEKNKKRGKRSKTDDVARVDGQRIYTSSELQGICDAHAANAMAHLKTKHGITVFAGELTLTYNDFDHAEDRVGLWPLLRDCRSATRVP